MNTEMHFQHKVFNMSHLTCLSALSAKQPEEKRSGIALKILFSLKSVKIISSNSVEAENFFFISKWYSRKVLRITGGVPNYLKGFRQTL